MREWLRADEPEFWELQLKDPIFVIGLPRSGSTLWENIIAENPEVLRLAEMLFLSPFRRDFRYFLRTNVGDLSDDAKIRKMVDQILARPQIKGIDASFWRFENIGAIEMEGFRDSLVDGFLKGDRSLEQIFKTLIEEITRFSGLSRCSVAFPVYPSYVSQLLQWYPDCKIVHVSRDPRAIAMSKTNDPSGTALLNEKYPRLRFLIRKLMIAFVIVQYVWVSRIHNRYKQVPNYRKFQYEDLVMDPENQIRTLCEFLRMDYSPSMLSPRQGMASSITGKKKDSIAIEPARHWRKVITPLEKMSIDLLTKRSMNRFDYPADAHPIYLSST